MTHVLIVDPSSNRGTSMKQMLEFAMMESDIVNSAEDAVSYLKIGFLPDVIVTNIINIGMDGLRFSRMVKQTPDWAHIPVIAICDREQIENYEDIVRRAGAALLPRPFQRDDFLAEIDRAVLMGNVQENPLANSDEIEEFSFIRDHNKWLAHVAAQATQTLEQFSEENNLRTAHLQTLHDITTSLSETLDLAATRQTLCRKTAELVRAQAVALYRRQDATTYELAHAAGFGAPTPSLIAEHSLDDESPIAQLSGRQAALTLHHLADVKRFQRIFELDLSPTSVVVSPLIARGSLSGYLVAIRIGDTDPFGIADADILFSLAGAAGLAIYSAEIVAELESAYINLKEMDKKRSEFVAITSHELRTPIAVMLGYASLLYDMEDDEMKKSQLGTIEKQANFLSGLVDTLINFHDLSTEDDPFKLRCGKVKFHELLQDAADATKMHGKYQHEIEIEIDCDPIYIQGDELRLLMAMNNLMDNALKFSQQDGVVSVVAVERPEGGVVVTIEDAGIGIAAEHLDQIFEPFFQVEAAMTRHHGGLGLGLTIVKGMVELHGGFVEVKSTLGEGTRFVLNLPAKPPFGRCIGDDD